MRKLFIIPFVILSMCSACSCNDKQEEKNTDTLTVIEFSNRNYDFGQVIKGEVVEHTYTFTNVGEKDLKISEVNPSCGCTIPEWTKDAIKPGRQGKIRIIFDTKHQNTGNKVKQVAVYSNTKPTRNLLQFSAQVITK